MASPAPPRVIRFGLFELDVSAGQLRKQNRTIKLQDQPLQVLQLLVSRPGDIVGRDEIQRALWPADTFVEFDQGLNTAIKKIRVALGHSADNPRFIETVPRKGYRFIAPVDRTATASATPPELGSAPLTVAERAAWPGLKSYWFWAAVSCTAALLVAAATLTLGRRVNQVPVPSPLTSYRGAEMSPSFSPDGKYVTFAWWNYRTGFNIFVKQIGAGDDPVQLTHSPEHDCSPVWSPDGSLIAFLRALVGAKSELFVISPIGGAERKIADVYVDGPLWYGPHVSWTPDAKWIVISDKGSPTGQSALFRVSVETGEKRRITNPPKDSGGDALPSVSPDGRALLFTRPFGGDLFLLELSPEMNAVGKLKRITSGVSVFFKPAWASDGSTVVYSAGAQQAPMLWKVRLSKRGWQPGTPERLAFAGTRVEEPSLSRQGRLAYTQTFVDVDIWRADLDGIRPANNAPTRLISSTRIDHEPHYSPDGQHIAFGSDRSDSMELWVAESDGSNPVRLTTFGGSHYCDRPLWSPDNRLIAFNDTVAGETTAYIISCRGGKPQRLPAHDVAGWSRDGRWLYFVSNSKDASELLKLPWPAPGGARSAARVGKHDALQPFMAPVIESDDGRFLYYLVGPAEGLNTVWRMPAEGGAETEILTGVKNDNFVVVRDGIYFSHGTDNDRIKYASFSTGKISTIRTPEREQAWGLSVSPDGKSLLYTGYEGIQSDLVLVDKFE